MGAGLGQTRLMRWQNAGASRVAPMTGSPAPNRSSNQGRLFRLEADPFTPMRYCLSHTGRTLATPVVNRSLIRSQCKHTSRVLRGIM